METSWLSYSPGYTGMGCKTFHFLLSTASLRGPATHVVPWVKKQEETACSKQEETACSRMFTHTYPWVTSICPLFFDGGGGLSVRLMSSWMRPLWGGKHPARCGLMSGDHDRCFVNIGVRGISTGVLQRQCSDLHHHRRRCVGESEIWT